MKRPQIWNIPHPSLIFSHRHIEHNSKYKGPFNRISLERLKFEHVKLISRLNHFPEQSSPKTQKDVKQTNQIKNKF